MARGEPAGVCAAAGRQPGERTRRDLIRALPAVSASEALEPVPRLRSDLLAAGIPRHDRSGTDEALTGFEQAQVARLYAADEDGRGWIWALTDEQDDAPLAASHDVAADTRERLAELETHRL